jgi:hypothetical protein
MSSFARFERPSTVAFHLSHLLLRGRARWGSLSDLANYLVITHKSKAGQEPWKATLTNWEVCRLMASACKWCPCLVSGHLRGKESAIVSIWYKEGLKSSTCSQEKMPMTTVAFQDVFAKLPTAELEASLQTFTEQFSQVLPNERSTH